MTVKPTYLSENRQFRKILSIIEHLCVLVELEIKEIIAADVILYMRDHTRTASCIICNTTFSILHLLQNIFYNIFAI